MPTNYKWFPGHYVLPYNVNLNDGFNDQGLTRHLNQIAEIPNLIGIQKRYGWRELEPTKGSYRFDLIRRDLDKCQSMGKVMRVFVTFKGFLSRPGAPDYLSQEAQFEGGIYNWGTPSEPRRNEHPRLWVPAVRDRLIVMMQRMGEALDNHPALSVVDFNETSWGAVPGADGAEIVARQRLMAFALRDLQNATKAAFPTTLVCHFLNFPNNAGFSVINDSASGLPASMLVNGIAIGGPDNWLDDFGLERPPEVHPPLPGVFWHYRAARGVTAISPSNQPGNYESKSHEDYTENPRVIAPDITIQRMYDRCTQTVQTYRGIVKEPLFATHVNWSARTDPVPASGSRPAWSPWDAVKDFFTNKWRSGADAGNTTPGVVTAIPATMEADAPEPPPAVVLSLASDTGSSATDLNTQVATLNVTGLVANSQVEYTQDVFAGWSATAPTPVQGKNTVLARQKLRGVPGPASEPLTYFYDTAAPVMVRATIDGDVCRVYFDDALPLSAAAGFLPDRTAFAVTFNGTAVNVDGRSVVVQPQNAIVLDLRTPAPAGAEVRVSYTPPATGNLRLQDLAGNYVPAFSNVLVNNVTGAPPLTNTATITTLGGAAPGGYTSQGNTVIEGTVASPLQQYDEVEVRRVFVNASTGVTSYVYAGTATVVGSSWSFTEEYRADRSFAWAARVRNGERFGPYSAPALVTVDTEPPVMPVLGSAAYRVGQRVSITGTWGSKAQERGEVLRVFLGSTEYTTANGVVINGASWSLDLGELPEGHYNVTASVTDLAGNVTESEEAAVIDVVPLPSINELRMAVAARAR